MFQKNKKIICCSIPCESNNKKMDKKETILNWWNTFEQKSVDKDLRKGIANWKNVQNELVQIFKERFLQYIDN